MLDAVGAKSFMPHTAKNSGLNYFNECKVFLCQPSFIPTPTPAPIYGWVHDCRVAAKVLSVVRRRTPSPHAHDNKFRHLKGDIRLRGNICQCGQEAVERSVREGFRARWIETDKEIAVSLSVAARLQVELRRELFARAPQHEP
jgi:hypothetical protein